MYVYIENKNDLFQGTQKKKASRLLFNAVPGTSLQFTRVRNLSLFPYIFLYLKNGISMILCQIRGCQPSNDVLSFCPSDSGFKSLLSGLLYLHFYFC